MGVGCCARKHQCWELTKEVTSPCETDSLWRYDKYQFDISSSIGCKHFNTRVNKLSSLQTSTDTYK
jgi:hypothetical protein